MRVMANVMAAHSRAVRPGRWARLALRRFIPNLTASLIAGPLVILRTCDTPDLPIIPHHTPTHQTSHAVKIMLDDAP
jgi:hypothetical protein